MANELAKLNAEPRVFISYAWTSAAHQQWIVDVATTLRGDGVDVILDVWDLKPGQDKFHFMEQMVADTSVQYVLVFCNAKYADKADSRSGGVGDETQIITPGIYAHTKNEKFIPVVAEFDENGEPYLPAYLKSRIYVDMSSEQARYDGYEKLLRLIHGAPAFPKPPLGAKPGFLADTATTGSSTSPLLRRALAALADEKKIACALAQDHLSAILSGLAALRFRHDQEKALDEEVWEAIGRSKVHRDEFLELLDGLRRYASPDATEPLLVRFFEGALSVCRNQGNQGQGGWHEAEFDGVRFALMELFIYTVAFLLSHDQLAVCRALLSEKYVLRESDRTVTKSYVVFWASLESIDRGRRQRTNSTRTSLVADLIKDRADREAVPFDQLQQTEFLLFLRGHLVPEGWSRWWPRTLVYLGHYPSRFEIFAAQESKRWFARLEAALNVTSSQDLRAKFFEAFPEPDSRRIRFGGDAWPIQIDPLLGFGEPA